MVGALPVLLARSWLLFGVNVVCILLVGWRFFPPGGAADPSEYAVGETLSIMTVNYPSWPSDDRERRNRAMLQLVQRERPDIIGLQEGWSYYGPDGRRLYSRPDGSMLADSASYLSFGPRRPDRTVSHVPIYSLFPLDVVNGFSVLPGPEGAGAVVTRAEATWRQREIVLFNVHLQSFGSAKPWREENSSWLNPRTWLRYLRQYRNAIILRAAQAEQIGAMIREEEVPVIVMGDFNSTRNNWDFNHAADGLIDVYRVAGSGRGATYHAKYPIARIDFILASEDFEAVSARVPSVLISDHRPVIATVALPE